MKRRNILTLFLSSTVIALAAQAENHPSIYGEENAHIHEVPEPLKSSFNYTNPQYWLFTPAQLKEGQLAPLIINLHGGGMRGNGSGDQSGKLMQLSAQVLPDEQAMKDVAAYIMTLESQGPSH